METTWLFLWKLLVIYEIEFRLYETEFDLINDQEL